ncbi:MAG TPA: J domain-containing protein [Alphaproteobacteria bacterium]|nr:J domain-containing protein [Alphaproteobacteria bacterium]
MPRIRLKTRSPEFAEPQERPATEGKTRLCDAPGCTAPGDHRAPRDRDLKTYYHFCLEHVQNYNKSWNYFEGLSDDQIQDHILNSLYGERPTRRYDIDGRLQEALQEKLRDFLGKTPPRGPQGRTRPPETLPLSPEAQALATLGLSAPVTIEEIRLRYRDLVRLHHPDRTGGDKESEEILKTVTMAYTILSQAHEKFKA